MNNRDRDTVGMRVFEYLFQLLAQFISGLSGVGASLSSAATGRGLACITHQRWKVSRTVVGIEDEKQEMRQIWDRTRAREVASDGEGILRQGSARNRQERVSSKRDEGLSWCRRVGRRFETETGRASHWPGGCARSERFVEPELRF